MGFDLDTKKPFVSVAAGALTAATGLDQVFPLPPIVHWSLAGASTDIFFRGMDALDSELIMCAIGGAVGGFVLVYMMR